MEHDEEEYIWNLVKEVSSRGQQAAVKQLVESPVVLTQDLLHELFFVSVIHKCNLISAFTINRIEYFHEVNDMHWVIGMNDYDLFLLAVTKCQDSHVSVKAEWFSVAAQTGNVPAMKWLLDNDPDIDPSLKDDVALRRAVRGGHINAVDMLLRDERVDPSTRCNYALRQSAVEGNDQLFLMISLNSRALAKAPTIDSVSNTATYLWNQKMRRVIDYASVCKGYYQLFINEIGRDVILHVLAMTFCDKLIIKPFKDRYRRAVKLLGRILF